MRPESDARTSGHVEHELARIAGRSPAMLEVKELLRRLAASPLPILVLGSTGTGKGLVANVIHAISGRPGPLEAFNCGTFSRDVIGPQLFGHRRGA